MRHAPIQLSHAGPAVAVRDLPGGRYRQAACQVSLSKDYWVEAFVALEILCQLVLALTQTGSLRPVLRCLSYVASLGLAAFLPGSGRMAPAAKAAIVVIAILAVSMLHPTTNSWTSGGAQVALYTAILAPLFWVSRLPVDALRFRRVLLMLWAFHTASSVVAILQVSHPNMLPQTLSVVTQAQGQGYVDSLRFRTASGVMVFRPMGLADVPGAASVSGFYAVLIGLGLALSEKSKLLRTAAFGSIAAGLTALYLSQVRAMLVMLVICIAGVYVVLLWVGERIKVLKVSVALLALLSIAWLGAVTIGGEAVTRRIYTLSSDEPGITYQQNRGHFLTDTVTRMLPEYPLGAGLGRWGMMNQYFGDESDSGRGRIWAEIQWTGWLLDGGVPLVLAYSACLFIAIWTAWMIAIKPDNGTLWIWAAIVLAYNIGALAITFDYPFFVSQSALEMWLLNAALFSSRHHIRVAVRRQSEVPDPIRVFVR